MLHTSIWILCVCLNRAISPMSFINGERENGVRSQWFQSWWSNWRCLPLLFSCVCVWMLYAHFMSFDKKRNETRCCEFVKTCDRHKKYPIQPLNWIVRWRRHTLLWDRFAIHSPFVFIRRSFYCIITDGFSIALRFVETNTLNSVMDWGLMFKQIYFWQSRIQLFFHLSFSVSVSLSCSLPEPWPSSLSYVPCFLSLLLARVHGWHITYNVHGIGENVCGANDLDAQAIDRINALSAQVRAKAARKCPKDKGESEKENSHKRCVVTIILISSCSV